jgi:Sulfatase-modifying factor enzyme 1
MSWGQGFEDSVAPGVLRNKWFERRHMVHMVDRWASDHSPEIHTAWMNGAGVVVWENVFGDWQGWSERDKSLLRSMLPIQRRFSDHFITGSWTPLVATAGPVYASMWEYEGTRLWTFVNREERRVEGPFIRVTEPANKIYIDLVRGSMAEAASDAHGYVVEGVAEPRAVGAVLETDRATADELQSFLGRQRELYEGATWEHRPPTAHTFKREKETVRMSQVSEGMIAIPAYRGEMTSTFRERECGTYEGHPFAVEYDLYIFDPEDPFDLYGSYTREVELASYAIDRKPVTNAEFQRFVRESGYEPEHPECYLHHWSGPVPPNRMHADPVVYVDDARAYAAWAGKRLPTEEEWQHALETTQLRDGDGRVWNWTESEQTDGSTRWCIIKSGSSYQAQGSIWYADGGHHDPTFSAKFILIWAGIDRCSTIGFRCAIDL